VSAALVRVPFHGGELLAVEGVYPEEGDRPIPLRPFCERLGVTMQAQLTKLKGKPWACITLIVTQVPGDSQTREMACLSLRAIPMWLATIDPSRVAAEAKEVLVAFQKEAAEVLHKHFAPRFAGGPASAPQMPAEPPVWAQGILARLMALEGKPTSPDHDGQIGPVRSATIRRQLLTFGQLMGHGDAKAARSWRTIGDNDLRAFLGYQGKGRAWVRLPVAKYSDALTKLEEMLARARKVDVEHVAALQLPLSPA